MHFVAPSDLTPITGTGSTYKQITSVVGPDHLRDIDPGFSIRVKLGAYVVTDTDISSANIDADICTTEKIFNRFLVFQNHRQQY